MNKPLKFLCLVFLIFLVIASVLYFFNNYPRKMKNTSLGRQPIYWVDAMEPTIHYDGPGKSRMNMNLQPVYADEQSKDVTLLTIPSQILNNLGMRTEVVQEEMISERIKAYGYITFDENKITHIHSYADGWLRKLFVKAIGSPVKKGQPLVGIYAPKLLVAQSELVLSLEWKDKTFIESSKQKLRSLNVTEGQIEEILKEHRISQLILMLAPHDGIITSLEVKEGMNVKPENTIMGIVDTSTMWVNLEIFPFDAPKVKVGQDVEIFIAGNKEPSFYGKIDYIYPENDPQIKTLRARIIVENTKGNLKAQQLINGIIIADSKKAITVNQQGIIYGSKINRVIVIKENNKFEPRIVTLGIQDNDRVEVKTGLSPNERIVTSGQFLIDSEANLRGVLDRLSVPIDSSMPEGNHLGTKAP